MIMLMRRKIVERVVSIRDETILKNMKKVSNMVTTEIQETKQYDTY